ncbi:hypothetical protein JCM19992_34860 [Thermostilla marina]
MQESRSLLTVKDVATALAVSPRTVWRWVSAGRLPQPIRLAPRTVRWRRQDIEAALHGKEVERHVRNR